MHLGGNSIDKSSTVYLNVEALKTTNLVSSDYWMINDTLKVY